MSEHDKVQPLGPAANPWNRWDARVGMYLAYWAYPHDDISKANKVAAYPSPWNHAKPGKELPANWPTASYERTPDGKTNLKQEGWNTQHNADGKLENRFMVSINRETKEITFDFKGSDAWSNWKSDLGNAGASEFAKIEAKAQAAFDALKNDERFKDYHFAATGHSLGGGMAQSFGLKNNIDVAVYNSLPIARDTRHGDYFKDVGGYEAALERYQNAGRTVHDVRTPNDIATYTFDGVMRNRYLSSHVGAGPTLLPGSSLPGPLKTVLMLSGAGTLVAGAAMGMDHTNGALVNAQQGLAVGADGRYIVPEGHPSFAQLPPEARKLFAQLSESPVSKVTRTSTRGVDGPEDRFELTHADGGRQFISVNGDNGAVDIDHWGPNGQRTRVEMNVRTNQPAQVTEYDANGRPMKTEKVALQSDTPPPVARAPGATPAEATHIARVEPSPVRPTPEQAAQAERFTAQLGPRLAQLGMSDSQIHTLAAAAAKEQTRFAAQGEAQAFHLSRDGSTIALRQAWPPLREFSVETALGQSEQGHWQEARAMAGPDAQRAVAPHPAADPPVEQRARAA